MNRPAAPPAYGALIETAREDAGLSRREAARRAGISDAWWRYVVQGWQNGPISGPADTVAKMALVVGVTPEQMETAGERADAAGELRKLLRDARAHEPAPLRAPASFPAAGDARDEVAEALLADLLSRYEGRGEHGVVQAMSAQRSVPAGMRVMQVLRFLKDPELDREVLAWLVSLRLDDDPLRVVQALGSRRGQGDQDRIADILEYLGWQPPDMRAIGNGTTG